MSQQGWFSLDQSRLHGETISFRSESPAGCFAASHSWSKAGERSAKLQGGCLMWLAVGRDWAETAASAQIKSLSHWWLSIPYWSGGSQIDSPLFQRLWCALLMHWGAWVLCSLPEASHRSALSNQREGSCMNYSFKIEIHFPSPPWLSRHSATFKRELSRILTGRVAEFRVRENKHGRIGSQCGVSNLPMWLDLQL